MRIKEVLKENGCTQQMLADKMNVSLSAVKQMVSAESLTTATLEKIATALNVPMWQLFASPEEVAKQTDNETCPYCGQPIAVKTTIEKVKG
ncbi:helix-turn-helix domain-containing protein [Bacteroides stercoris]|jgi:transcriptional regulator with XRE-family HTH domain|uniref:XRE family transcriptional regulator n=1 Tax=Bacteroides stercoris TaxID=46506 RepID=A0A413B4J5_BACSE|nr:helix-turn-helix transcriptional regulator [Bacteroides stercoris]RGW32816.1 XRE family transcriptional regulator [Bacteroides stercoris]